MAARVLFLTGLPRGGPSARVRVYEHLPRLAALGVEGVVRPFLLEEDHAGFYSGGALDAGRRAAAGARGLLRRLRELGDARRFDVVVVHREIVPRGNRAALRRLRRAGRPVVVDLDDAIWLSPRDHVAEGDASRRRMVRFKDPAEIDDLLRGADRVAAGCPAIAEHARRLQPRVDLVPTPVDTDRIRPAGRARRERPLVGWIGSPTAAYCLRAILPALARVARRRPFDLLVVGAGERIEAPGLRVRNEPWSEAREAADLASLDVGLYPLPDNPWTRGKCGYKALQYFAAGAAAIVSPVGVSADLAAGGERALVASAEGEWEDALDRLLGDADLRARLAERARRFVEARYSYAAVTPLLARCLETALEGSP